MAAQALFPASLALLSPNHPFAMLIAVLRKACGPVDLFTVTVHTLFGGLVYHDGIADLVATLDVVNQRAMTGFARQSKMTRPQYRTILAFMAVLAGFVTAIAHGYLRDIVQGRSTVLDDAIPAGGLSEIFSGDESDHNEYHYDS